MWGSETYGKLAFVGSPNDIMVRPKKLNCLNYDRELLKDKNTDKHIVHKNKEESKRMAAFTMVACGKYHSLFLIGG